MYAGSLITIINYVDGGSGAVPTPGNDILTESSDDLLTESNLQIQTET